MDESCAAPGCAPIPTTLLPPTAFGTNPVPDFCHEHLRPAKIGCCEIRMYVTSLIAGLRAGWGASQRFERGD